MLIHRFHRKGNLNAIIIFLPERLCGCKYVDSAAAGAQQNRSEALAGAGWESKRSESGVEAGVKREQSGSGAGAETEQSGAGAGRSRNGAERSGSRAGVEAGQEHSTPALLLPGNHTVGLGLAMSVSAVNRNK